MRLANCLCIWQPLCSRTSQWLRWAQHRAGAQLSLQDVLLSVCVPWSGLLLPAYCCRCSAVSKIKAQKADALVEYMELDLASFR